MRCRPVAQPRAGTAAWQLAMIPRRLAAHHRAHPGRVRRADAQLRADRRRAAFTRAGRPGPGDRRPHAVPRQAEEAHVTGVAIPAGQRRAAGHRPVRTGLRRAVGQASWSTSHRLRMAASKRGGAADQQRRGRRNSPSAASMAPTSPSSTCPTHWADQPFPTEANTRSTGHAHARDQVL